MLRVKHPSGKYWDGQFGFNDIGKSLSMESRYFIDHLCKNFQFLYNCVVVVRCAKISFGASFHIRPVDSKKICDDIRNAPLGETIEVSIVELTMDELKSLPEFE